MNKPQKIKSIFNIQRIKGVFVRNTIWMLLGLLGRVGLQALYFIIIARSLKPEEYGSFIGSFALVAVLLPFVSWGSGDILIKHVSRRKDSFPNFWGMTISVSLLSAFLLSVISLLLGFLILSQEAAWNLVLPIALGSFFGDSFAGLSGQAFQAHNKLSRTSLVLIFSGFFRLGSALLLILLPITKTAENWAILYMLSSFLSGITGLVWVKRELGWGPMGLKKMHGEWREGFFFSIGDSAIGSNNDMDKTLLVRLASNAAAGEYSAAYRMIDAAFIPVRAMISAAYPRFFQEGEKGPKEASRFALHLLPWAAGWGLIVGFGLILMAPLLPLILGKEYAETTRILVWLVPIPLFRGFSYLAADTLTGSGFQGFRSGVQISIALLNFGLNLWLIPHYGWLGAAWSSLISDGLLAAFLWILNFILAQRKLEKEI